MSSYVCVRKLSPVSFTVIGYSKACVQSLIGIIFLGETQTVQSVSGILLTMLGGIWYGRIKYREGEGDACETKNEMGKESQKVDTTHDASRDKKLESEIKSEDDFKSEVDSKDSEDDSTRPTEMEELVDEGRAKPYERQSVATRG
eukprot:Selendium_serpulae@DN4669_c0_g1_i2.p2